MTEADLGRAETAMAQRVPAALAAMRAAVAAAQVNAPTPTRTSSPPATAPTPVSATGPSAPAPGANPPGAGSIVAAVVVTAMVMGLLLLVVTSQKQEEIERLQRQLFHLREEGTATTNAEVSARDQTISALRTELKDLKDRQSQIIADPGVRFTNTGSTEVLPDWILCLTHEGDGRLKMSTEGYGNNAPPPKFSVPAGGSHGYSRSCAAVVFHSQTGYTTWQVCQADVCIVDVVE